MLSQLLLLLLLVTKVFLFAVLQLAQKTIESLLPVHANSDEVCCVATVVSYQTHIHVTIFRLFPGCLGEHCWKRYLC